MNSRDVSLALVALTLLALAACGGDADQPPTAATADTFGWKEVAPQGSGGFPPVLGSNDRPPWEPGKYPLALQPMIGFRGDLWAVTTTLAFSSPDGLTWTKLDKDATPGRLAATYTFFNDKLWMFAGSDFAAQKYYNEIWSSADGTHWSKGGEAAWPGRDSTTIVTFQDKLWLFGGATHRDPVTGSTDAFLNDVWSSEDGLRWTQVTAAAPWSPRDYPRVEILNDGLYMVGGQEHPDVWRSTNGTDWTLLTPEAEWGQRHDYATEVLGGKLWVFGGWKGKSTNALNDVWYSEDGVRWRLQTEHAPWEERDPISIVYKDKIWIFGGKHTGGDPGWNSDIWTMTAPR